MPERTKNIPGASISTIKISSDYGPEAIPEFDQCASSFRLSLKESYNYYYVPITLSRLPVSYERMVRNGEKLMQQLKEFMSDRIRTWTIFIPQFGYAFGTTMRL